MPPLRPLNYRIAQSLYSVGIQCIVRTKAKRKPAGTHLTCCHFCHLIVALLCHTLSPTECHPVTDTFEGARSVLNYTEGFFFFIVLTLFCCCIVSGLLAAIPRLTTYHIECFSTLTCELLLSLPRLPSDSGFTLSYTIADTVLPDYRNRRRCAFRSGYYTDFSFSTLLCCRSIGTLCSSNAMITTY